MAKVSGGAVAARFLKNEGVEKIFGIIDGTYFGFYSSAVGDGIELVSPRHETSAAHMAGAYARSSGRLGVCMASNGPGVANILPGLVVEQAEGNRVLVITSARRTGIMYPDRGGTYQCFDQSGVIGQIAKHSEAVHSFERIPEVMKRALRYCFEGRPGVVHVDIPENIMNGKFEGALPQQSVESYRRTAPVSPDAEQLEQARKLLTDAKLPMIHAGGGIIHAEAYAELQELAELLGSPVTTSWGARGVLSEEHELAIPMVNISLNNRVRNAADVVLTLGSRIGETDWWGKAPYWAKPSEQKMIQVDMDPMILGANKPAAIPIQADVKTFMKGLIAALKKNGRSSKPDLSSFDKRKIQYREKLDKSLEKDTEYVHPARAVVACRDAFPDNSILVADGGNTAIWANFYWKVKTPGTLLSTFKFGMLGAGVAQALGAAKAHPDRPVCCIIGDGAMGFHPQEIETAVRHNLKIVYVVLCDKQWGMVKMNQSFTLRPWKMLLYKSLDPGETIAADLGEIRFDQVAEAMGAHGERVSRNEGLNDAVNRCLGVNGPSVIHVDVDPVAHMWAPGLRYFKAMHEEPSGK
ncbi:MAG: thiamine pyrophosphate-binding protein [Spirochaetaceae bacterium]|nr:thiamine pyrophosphate-binding protein [Spirochaetaceae bacterium]|tara:strand:+ start:3281 stop:5020 length:1740 start_codon:yes stop_codon:yes gene_type:complete